MKMSPPARTGRKGFTLVEILCALAVLSILVLLISQLMSGAAKTVTLNQNHMDEEGQMRTVYATMGNDLANMVKQPNVDVLFSKQSGNDYMCFYSEAAAYFDPAVFNVAANKSPFSLVGYQAFPYLDPQSGKNLYHLERYSRALAWDGPTAGPIYYTYSIAKANGGYTNYYIPNTNYCAPDPATTLAGGPWADIPGTSTTDTAPGNVNYHVIADGVFRLEYSFLHTDGTFSDDPRIPPPNSNTLPKAPNIMTDVVAVIVTVAELDPASQRLIPDMSALAGSSIFADSGLTPGSTQQPPPTTPPTLMATNWQTALQNELQTATNGQTTMGPLIAVSRIRIYQHFFYLNND